MKHILFIFMLVSNLAFGFSASTPIDLQQCRNHISEAVCLQDAEGNCLPESGDYAIHFEQLFDIFPAYLQKMFCAIDIIAIYDNETSTGWTNPIMNGFDVVGAILGINRAVLDTNYPIDEWYSWKLQLPFKQGDEFVIEPNLPQVRTHFRWPLPAGINQSLYFVVVHEMGHMFDMANAINHPYCTYPLEADGNVMSMLYRLIFSYMSNPTIPLADYVCGFEEDSWSRISWAESFSVISNDLSPVYPVFEILPRYKYFGWEDLYFYDGGETFIAYDDIPKVFRQLEHKTNFLNLYSSKDSTEDWAESFAFYVMTRELGMVYKIDTKQGQIYNVTRKMRHPKFRAKLNFIRDFLNSDYNYPR